MHANGKRWWCWKSGRIYFGRDAICVPWCLVHGEWRSMGVCGKLKNRNDDKNVMKRKWWTLLHVVLLYVVWHYAACVCAMRSHFTQWENVLVFGLDTNLLLFRLVFSLETHYREQWHTVRFVDLIDRQIIFLRLCSATLFESTKFSENVLFDVI